MKGARLEVFPSPELFDRAAAVVADAMQRRIAEEGRCAIALSGGSTPAPMFRRLAAAEIDWSVVDVFQVDERVAPAGHPDRNLTLIQRDLCGHIPDGDGLRLHPMDVTTHRLDAAAVAYAEILEHVCGRPPVIDVAHLGLGADGHIASLVPDDPVLDVRDRWAALTRSYRGYVRMTLTYPVLDDARLVVLLVEGEDKAEALAAVLNGDRDLPAGRLAASDVIVLADPAAASAAR